MFDVPGGVHVDLLQRVIVSFPAHTRSIKVCEEIRVAVLYNRAWGAFQVSLI